MNRQYLENNIETCSGAAYEFIQSVKVIPIDTLNMIIKGADSIETNKEPKKPIVPPFVDEYLRSSFSYEVLEDDKQFVIWETYKELFQGEINEEMVTYLNGKNEFNEAVINGYTVEEKKYYVVNKNGSIILERNRDTEYDDTIAYAVSGRLMKHLVAQNEEYLYQFTEKEIKDYDPRYMAFAEETTIKEGK